MDEDGDGRGFAVRAVAVAPGCRRVYDDGEWRDAIVVVKCGEIELECTSGASHRFGRGDLLWLTGLPLRALHNHGREPTVLVAVSRALSLAPPIPPGIEERW
jgi:hypothetical protein